MAGIIRTIAAAPALLVAGIVHHPWRAVLAGAAVVAALVVVGIGSTFEGLPVVSTQLGFRGTGMIVEYNPRTQAREISLNRLETPYPPATPAGQTAQQAYKNIQVLQDVDANEFLRLMATMANWVSPTIGCSYCHSAVNMADDKVYTKEVTRHMIQMVRYINTNWKEHVGEVGVTCNTCHRGNGIPANVWHIEPPPDLHHGAANVGTGLDTPAAASGLTSLPNDPFTPFLLQSNPIRVQGTTALPSGNTMSTKQTYWTYGLMVHFADSLGVSCNFCHNTRAFGDWDQGTPNRVNAWTGIQMVRDVNEKIMVPITGLFPPGRLGPTGDVAKVNCATCHQGAYKPFYGASTLDAYPELKGPSPNLQSTSLETTPSTLASRSVP